MKHRLQLHPFLYALIVGILFFCSACEPVNTNETVLKSLQGEWEVIRAEAEGKAIAVQDKRFILKGNQLIPNMTPENSAEIFLAPEMKPAWIDLTDQDQKKMLGIYALEGRSWKICLSDVGDARPTEFKTTLDTTTYLMELRRMSN